MNKYISSPDITLDIVYTYVNMNDNKWLNKVKKYKKSFSNYNKKRFNFFGEIYYSLQTVQKYFSWVNNIYIVHDNQEFDIKFLSEKFRKKIIFIDHKEIIPHKYLPIFNSMLIKMFISKIPNLSDYFIYMNDDFFFGNYVTQDFFFDNNRVFKQFIKDNKKPYTIKEIQEFPFLIRLYNTHNLVKKILNKDYYFKNIHVSWNLNKYILKITFKLFNKFFVKMLKTQRFRTYNENTYEFLLLSSIMANHFKISKNVNISNKIFFSRNINMHIYNSLLIKKPYIFTINEINNSNEHIWKLLQNNYMKKITDDNSYNSIKNI